MKKKVNLNFNTVLYDGKMPDGISYEYVPFVAIYDKDKRHIAKVYLTSMHIGGTEEQRKKDERIARLMAASSDLEAMLLSILSIPELTEIENRNEALRGNGCNMVKDAYAILDYIEHGGNEDENTE